MSEDEDLNYHLNGEISNERELDASHDESNKKSKEKIDKRDVIDNHKIEDRADTTIGNHKIENQKVDVEKSNQKREDIDDVVGQLNEFYNECFLMSTCANTKAEIYRTTSIISSTIILLLGITTSILSRFDTPIINDVITGLGATITAIQMFIYIYNPEKKAVIIKRISQNLARITREIRKLKGLPLNKVEDRLEQYHSEVDNLDLAMFNLNMNYVVKEIRVE